MGIISKGYFKTDIWMKHKAVTRKILNICKFKSLDNTNLCQFCLRGESKDYNKMKRKN